MLKLFFLNSDNSIFSFFMQNQSFIQRIGFSHLLKNSNLNGSKLKSYFLIYLTLLSEHSAIEQLTKGGHILVVENWIQNLLQAKNKKTINTIFHSIESMIERNSNKGHEILRFPKYISVYLTHKKASLEEYKMWIDIYEYTNISEHDFQTLINDIRFNFLRGYLSQSMFSSILKFGYPDFLKLISFLYKEIAATKFRFKNTYDYLYDYLNMCDELEVPFDLFPHNIKGAHDRVLAEYLIFKDTEKKKENEIIMEKMKSEMEQKLKKIYDNAKQNNSISALLKEFVVKIPFTFAELQDEGVQQNNCVGGYFSKIKDKKTIILFIRDINTPDKSLVTVEILKTKLGQVKYRNNKDVDHHSKEYKLAEWISKQISV